MNKEQRNRPFLFGRFLAAFAKGSETTRPSCLAALLILTLLVSSSYALRPAGLEESNERGKVAEALAGGRTSTVSSGPQDLTVEEVQQAAKELTQRIRTKFAAIEVALGELGHQQAALGTGNGQALGESEFNEAYRQANIIWAMGFDALQAVKQIVRDGPPERKFFLNWVVYELNGALNPLMVRSQLYPAKKDRSRKALQDAVQEMSTAFQESQAVLAELSSRPYLVMAADGEELRFVPAFTARFQTIPNTVDIRELDEEARALQADRIFLISLGLQGEEVRLRPYHDLVRLNRYEDRLKRYFERANRQLQKAGMNVRFETPGKLYLLEGESAGPYDFVVYEGELSEDISSRGYVAIPVGQFFRMNSLLLTVAVRQRSANFESLQNVWKGLKVERVEFLEEGNLAVVFARGRSA